MLARRLRKVCHWGPVIALGIIKIITLMTINCSRQWWSPYESPLAVANFILFFSLSGSTIYHFMSAIIIGPGFLDLGWTPETVADIEYLQFCSICQGYKAPRSHHCRKCGRCVLKMDHHCPWINNCVGHRNHGHFAAFLASAVGGCCVSTIILVSWVTTVLFKRNLPFPPPSMLNLVIAVFTIGLSIGVILAVGMLLYFQVSAILRNTTGIEDWILEKAQARRFGLGQVFVHPYSKGWLFNVQQVLSWNCRPVGDGIIWPVIVGCDQYTLTREQLAQKLGKRQRARLYRVTKSYSGSWLPVNYGWQVLCHPPCTDESRIELAPGNIVIVTRWRKHWLFGEKKNDRAMDDRARLPRGWFPRASVIEVTANGSNFPMYSKAD